MFKYLKRHWLSCLLITAILYLAIGAVTPFIHYKEMDEDARKTADAMMDVQAVLDGQESVDRVMLVESNAAALTERLRLIQMAKEEIILSSFDIRTGESTRDLISLLLKKADEGVHIRIMVDGISGVIRMQGRQEFALLNESPNVEIRLYNRLNLLTPWKTQGRMHDKYVIVDDIGYLLGGRNTFDYFLGEYDTKHRNTDRELLIYNTRHGEDSRESSLFAVEEYFNSIWESGDCTDFKGNTRQRDTLVQKEKEKFAERYRGLEALYPELLACEPSDYEAMTYETEGVWLLHNPTGIYGKEPYVFYNLARLMEEAGEPVVFHSPYVVCNDYMYDRLGAVSEDVPSMELLINSVENGGNFFASGDYMWNKQKVLDTGTAVYEYDGGLSYHGKSVLIGQDIAVVGSYNLDLRSTYVDTEVMLAVHCPELNAEMSGYMETMKQDSRHVVDEDSYETPEGWNLPDMSGFMRSLMKVVGVLMQPFRYLI